MNKLNGCWLGAMKSGLLAAISRVNQFIYKWCTMIRAGHVGALCLAVALALVAPAGLAEVPKVLGQSYGELSVAWWQWGASIPKASNDPISAEGAVDCAQGQRGPVFFLAGLPVDYGSLGDGFTELSGQRECIVPVGKPLFFPFVNAVFYNAPGEEYTIAEKRDALDFYMIGARFFCGAVATVDGSTPYELSSVRVQSATFLISPVDGNVFDMPAGTFDEEAVSDGYWMLVPAMSKGHHTLTFRGTFCVPADAGDPSSDLEPYFSVEMTYSLTVGG